MPDSNYSLSDLSAVLGGRDGMFGNAGGGSWIVMLLIFFLFFRNGNGWGGDFGNILGNVATPAATQDSVRSILENQNTEKILDAIQGNAAAISQLAQSTGISFDRMNDAICNTRTAIIETANATNLSVKELGTQIALGNSQILSQMQNCCCQIITKVSDSVNQLNVNMLTGFNATDKTLCDIKSVVAADFAALQYQNEKNTSALIQAGNANTAKVLEFLTNDKLNTLQTDLALAKAEISQRDQTQNIVNQLKGSCGCGCGCGNSCNC